MLTRETWLEEIFGRLCLCLFGYPVGVNSTPAPMLFLMPHQSPFRLVHLIFETSRLFFVPIRSVEPYERIHKPAIPKGCNAVFRVQVFPVGAVHHERRIMENREMDKGNFATRFLCPSLPLPRTTGSIQRRGICDSNHDLIFDVHLPAGREPQGSRFKLLTSWQHASSGSSARYIYVILPPRSSGYAWGLQ